MNNNQKKLFNIANKIEKLLYSCGNLIFYKDVGYSYILIHLYSGHLSKFFLKELIVIVETVNMSIILDENKNLKIKIW